MKTRITTRIFTGYFLIVLLSLSNLSCKNNGGNNETAVYSPVFYGSDPAIGIGMNIYIWKNKDIADVCRRDFSEEFFQIEGLEYFLIRLSHSEPGKYRVIPPSFDQNLAHYAVGSQKVAFVDFVIEHEIDVGPEDRTSALSGVVEFFGEPVRTEADWAIGKDSLMKVTLEAEFPVDNIKTVGCNSIYDDEFNVISSECICQSENSEQFSCVPESQDVSCCIAPTAETQRKSKEVESTLCGYFCGSDTAERFDSNCLPLFELEDTRNHGENFSEKDKYQGDPANIGISTIYSDAWSKGNELLFVTGYSYQENENSFGFIKIFNEKKWETLFQSDKPFSNLKSIWGSSVHSVYSVGSRGTIFHYNGKVTETVESSSIESSHNYNGIWGSGANDIFVCGNDGTILHYDGSTWNIQSSGTNLDLNAINGISTDNVIIVGDQGLVLRFDGNAWTNMNTGISNDLNAAWIKDDSTVYAAGGQDGAANGIVIKYNGESWIEQLNADMHDLVGISGINDNVITVGAVRDDNGEAKAVIWRLQGEEWKLLPYDSIDAYLWNIWCGFRSTCYIFGTSNVFFSLQ